MIIHTCVDRVRPKRIEDVRPMVDPATIGKSKMVVPELIKGPETSGLPGDLCKTRYQGHTKDQW